MKARLNFAPYILFGILFTGCNNTDNIPVSNSIALTSGWTLHTPDTLSIYPATVPGTVHTDLLAAGVIADPFHVSSEAALQWIENKDWWYTCNFDIPDYLNEYDAAELVFEGLDTYATVWLNDVEILSADNMFRSWSVAVDKLLQAGQNELKIKFESPVKKHAENLSIAQLVLPADNDYSKTSPYARKAAYHFGWDWAPRMVTSGIGKPVHIDFYRKATLRNCFIEQVKITEAKAVLKLHAEIENFSANPIAGAVHIAGKKWEGTLEPGKQTITIDFEINNPQLWWPNEEGAQHMYQYVFELYSGQQQLALKPLSIGLRSVELVNEPDDSGTSFYFKINGKPVFMKGANYVPQDVFLPRVADAQYRELLTAARDANMNMLRVWGGGVYERDIFYHLCDSLGILVWQDFMFAGTMYPSDSAFMANVEAEVHEQVKRLRAHPCIAIWCGNNEIEVAWRNWGWQAKYDYSSIESDELWKGYEKLFMNLIPEIVQRESPHIPYVHTTPQSNWGKEENFNHGSMHYWGVWHGREPASAFTANVGRFMVEYGLQSYPEPATLYPYIDSIDRRLDSPAMISLQKSYIGNSEIYRHIHDMGLTANDLESFIYASQQAQANALELAIDAHVNSQGHCMGSLLWQLNDCRPGPSWSIIDYHGRKKLAYDAVKKGFAPGQAK